MTKNRGLRSWPSTGAAAKKNKALIEYRTKAGLSQTEAARRIGISNVTLWKYEAGLMSPKRKLKKIARVYKCSSSDLVSE